MSSWSCPYLDTESDHCRRLDKPCVPGRQGCVLPLKLVFATPVAERVRLADERAKALGRHKTKPVRAKRATPKAEATAMDDAVNKDNNEVNNDNVSDRAQACPLTLARDIVRAYEDAKVRGVCEDGAVEAAAEPLHRAQAARVIGLLHQGLVSNREVAQSLFATIPAERATEQPPGVVNHAAWTIAHLNHYHPAIMDLIQGRAVHDPGQHPDAARYDAGSTPIADPGAYPSWGDLVSRYDRAHADILEALGTVSHQTLAQPPGLARWAEAFADTASALQYLVVHHEAIHLGELTVWCRATGLLVMESDA